MLNFFSTTHISVAKVKSKLIFNNGKKITGYILPSKNTDSIRIQLNGGFNIAYAKSSIKEIKSLRKRVSIGIGRGIPYAVFGVNAEMEPIRQIDFTFGIGTTILAGLAWDVGIVGYALDQDYSIRPKISLIYGTNSFIVYNFDPYSTNDIGESFAGFSIGAGLKTMLGDSYGMTIDIFYLLSNGAEDRKKQLVEENQIYFRELGIPIKFSVGYQFSF